MARVTAIKKVEPEFRDVRKWYEEHLHPDANDYNDPEVYKHVYHDGAFVGVFQLTSRGAQKLFTRAKPESIIDIAVLTSIYRPGPLVAGVDKIYLEAKNEGKVFDWGHPLFEKVLGKTYNCLIFQESVMDLAEVVGGFPKDQCDNVRRAIMKRDLSKGESAIKAAKEMEDKFVEGAMKNGVLEETARKSYQQILWYAGYGFNKSHAIAYAIDSYMCAWLLTHYPDEWCTAYLESMQGSPENKAEASAAVKSIGYRFVPIDINEAGSGWTVLPGKRFMPSLSSIKGLGGSAVEEILHHRPYRDIKDLLWADDWEWKHSKFNRKALEGLIRLRALDSLDAIGDRDDQPFASYRHMYHVLIENSGAVKKTSKRDKAVGYNNMLAIARETREQFREEWTRQELVEAQIELLGSVDIDSIVSPEGLVKLHQKGIRSIEELDTGEKDVVWFVGQALHMKKSKSGKQYALIEAMGPSGKVIRLNVWGWKGGTIEPFQLFLAEVERNDFGCSTTAWKLKTLTL
jgi:DNA polymerase III alpha subunit